MERKPLFQSSTLTSEERRDEADQLLKQIDERERELSRKDSVVLEWNDGREITPRMLYWLRDIRDRYCL